jgi:hypothetical protein
MIKDLSILYLLLMQVLSNDINQNIDKNYFDLQTLDYQTKIFGS